MFDPAATRALFDLPDGIVYLDGNSLGPLPRAAGARAREMIAEEWGLDLIRGWTSRGWIDLPGRVGDRIGALIGAPAGSVTVGETLSVRLFQALSAALAARPDRRIVLTDSGNFPSDLYIAQGLIRALDRGHELRVVDPETVADHLGEEVAVVMLTQVDYRTGRRHDLDRLTAQARAAGALAVWDLAHSAGAFPVDVAGAGADFAVGCTYKYLNGGPGAPAFIYTAPGRAAKTLPAITGWLGHADPFAFASDYRPAAGARGLRIGTPPVLALSVLDAALDVWGGVDLAAIRAASLRFGDLLIARVEAACPEVALASPRDGASRGSHVSFRHPEGYAVMQALIARGVIGDFRAPDLMRFGIAPLYVTQKDIHAAADALAEVLATRAWDRPEFRQRKTVT